MSDDAQPPSPQSPPALSPPPPPGASRHLWCFAVVALLVALDLWSKARVFAWLEELELSGGLVRDATGHFRDPLLGEWLAFMRNLNYGAAFGQLTGIPHLLVGLRCLAVVLLSWLILRAPRGQRAYLGALVLIVAGAAGNLYDNFFYEPTDPQPGRPYGPVRDFIDVYFGIWRWHFPTFNVADSCITVGAALLLLSGLGGRSRTRSRTRPRTEEGDRDPAVGPQDPVGDSPGDSPGDSRGDPTSLPERVAPPRGLD